MAGPVVGGPQAVGQGCQRDERVGRAQLPGCGSGWRGGFGQALDQCGQRVTVPLQHRAFVVGQLELLQQLLDAVLDRQQLPGA
jgi:hypothetical protein